jgi:hypothetical protein
METQTAMRKNIYIPDSMKDVLDHFEKAGGNFSEVCQKALTEWVEADSVSKGKMGKIEVKVRTNLREVTKVFQGCWLVRDFVPLGKVLPDEFPTAEVIGIALTARGAIAVYTRERAEAAGDLEIFDSIEEASQRMAGIRARGPAFEEAAKKLPLEKQELDI